MADAISRLLEAVEQRFGFSHPPTDPVAAYPVILAGLTWGVGCLAHDDYKAAGVGVFRAGSALKVGLIFPPGSNMHIARFGGDREYSPVAAWGDYVVDRLYAFSEAWIPRRGEFEEAFDRFDLLVAVSSIRLGELWIPRCFVRTDPGGRFSRFKEIFEEWFVPLATSGSPKLSEVFSVIPGSPEILIAALQKEAEEQQKRWKWH